MKIRITHKGWFGVCPVYFGALNSDAPLVIERNPLLAPLLTFSEFVFGLVMSTMELAGQEPPGYPLRITGELNEPFYVDVPRE